MVFRIAKVTAEDKELQKFVKGVIQSVVKVELYPKTLIQVIVQELESDRPNLSLALNCIFTALLDAGIGLNTTFTASTVAVLPCGRLLPHPSHNQLTEKYTLLTVVFDNCSDQILAIRQQGHSLSRQKVIECVNLCRLECQHVWQALSLAVKSSDPE